MALVGSVSLSEGEPRLGHPFLRPHSGLEIQRLGSGPPGRVWGGSLGAVEGAGGQRKSKGLPSAGCQRLLREAGELSVGSARQELLTARFLGHHPGCPANSQAMWMGWGEGRRRSASQAQTLPSPLFG